MCIAKEFDFIACIQVQPDLTYYCHIYKKGFPKFTFCGKLENYRSSKKPGWLTFGSYYSIVNKPHTKFDRIIFVRIKKKSLVVNKHL